MGKSSGPIRKRGGGGGNKYTTYGDIFLCNSFYTHWAAAGNCNFATFSHFEEAKQLQRTSQELLGQTSQLDILYTSYICIYMQPHLAAPVGVGVSNGRAQSLSGPNCSSDTTSAICRCIVVVVVPLRATPTPQPAAAAIATAAAKAQRKLASLCDKSFFEFDNVAWRPHKNAAEIH